MEYLDFSKMFIFCSMNIFFAPKIDRINHFLRLNDEMLLTPLGVFKRFSRGKSLLELWVTTFLPDWQPPFIFVRFISNFLCMCSNSMASAHVILKWIRQRLRVAVSREKSGTPQFQEGFASTIFTICKTIKQWCDLNT